MARTRTRLRPTGGQPGSRRCRAGRVEPAPPRRYTGCAAGTPAGRGPQPSPAPALAAGSRAGQFVHVRTGDLSGLVLRRPFSINTADLATGTITIHFRTVGRGAAWFTHLRPGDTIDMLGPLGRPFEVDARSRHLLLVAGGPGMAGVRYLAAERIRDGRQVTLLFGAA